MGLLCATYSWFDIVDDALAEDWNGELISLVGAQFILASLEEEFVGFGADKTHDGLSEDGETETIAKLSLSLR